MGLMPVIIKKGESYDVKRNIKKSKRNVRN